MLRIAFLLISLAASLASAQQRDDDEVVLVGNRDPEMIVAIRTARAELDQFLALASAPPAETSGYKLKVIVRDGESTEHFWVTPFSREPNGFTGTLANDPRVVRNVKAGQTLRFARDQISDWGYVRNGRQVGSFTVCVLLKKMPAEQATYYRKNYGFDC